MQNLHSKKEEKNKIWKRNLSKSKFDLKTVLLLVFILFDFLSLNLIIGS